MTKLTLQDAFTPNEVVSRRELWIIAVGWMAVFAAFWTIARPAIFPSLLDIVNAFPALWTEDGLWPELVSSITVNLQALALACAFSLPVAYVSRTPAFEPWAWTLVTLRFLSPAVFYLPLLFLASTGHEVKVLMLALGESVFLVTSVVDIVQAVPPDRLDDCRTLRMNEWQVTWYAIIRGTADQVIDAIRGNAAMGWSMLMMVEGFVRSDGGIGVLILNNEKHMNFAECWCLAAVIVLVGVGQDWLLVTARSAACPWSVRA